MDLLCFGDSVTRGSRRSNGVVAEYNAALRALAAGHALIRGVAAGFLGRDQKS